MIDLKQPCLQRRTRELKPPFNEKTVGKSSLPRSQSQEAVCSRINKFEVCCSHWRSVTGGSYQAKRPVCMYLTELMKCQFAVSSIPTGNTATHLDQRYSCQSALVDLKHPLVITAFEHLPPQQLVAVT